MLKTSIPGSVESVECAPKLPTDDLLCIGSTFWDAEKDVQEGQATYDVARSCIATLAPNSPAECASRTGVMVNGIARKGLRLWHLRECALCSCGFGQTLPWDGDAGAFVRIARTCQSSQEVGITSNELFQAFRKRDGDWLRYPAAKRRAVARKAVPKRRGLVSSQRRL